MRTFTWNIVFLLWNFLPSSFGDTAFSSAYFNNIFSDVYGVTEDIKSICDRENNWWELTWGSNPSYNGIRAAKHDTARRNITWLGITTPIVQAGITTSTLHTEMRRLDNLSMPVDYLHKMFGRVCSDTAAPQIYLKGAPSLQCTMTSGIAQCPDKDNWNRVFMWFNWNGKPFFNAAPLGVEIKRKTTDDFYRATLSLSAAKQTVTIVDMIIELVGKDMRRTLKIPVLGLTASSAYKQDILPKKTVTKSESSVMNSAGKKILHIQEVYTVYKENFTTFNNFSFGVPIQDELRQQAVQYKFNFKKEFPRVQRKSLYKFALTARDLVYLGNETYNVWKSGEIERWKFVNASSPLLPSDGIIHQIYVYNSSRYEAGYEVAKTRFPFFHIAVNREWQLYGSDLKKFFFQFNPNSIVPAMKVTYFGDQKSKTVIFKLPTPDYGMSWNFTYKFDHDGVLLWSVKKTDLWGCYENPLDVFSGYIQYGYYHILVVIKKNDVFSSYYTRLLTYFKLLTYTFQSNYGEHIYNRTLEEIGEGELEKFIYMMKEIPTLEAIYQSYNEAKVLLDPEGWQKLVYKMYDMLQQIGKVEDTEEEFIISYDLRNLPFSFILDYVYMFFDK